MLVFLLFLFLWHSTSLRSLSWPGPLYVDYPLNWLNSTGHCLCMQGSQECTNRPVGFCNNTDYGIIQPFSFLPWDQQTQGQWWSCCGVTTTFQWRITSVLSLVHRRFKCLFGFLSVPLPHPSSLFSFFCHFFLETVSLCGSGKFRMWGLLESGGHGAPGLEDYTLPWVLASLFFPDHFEEGTTYLWLTTCFAMCLEATGRRTR